MAKAESMNVPVGVERRLASVSVPLDRVTPEALLRLGEGGPRGLWVREGRWFAHIGETARVAVVAPEEGRHRFRQVWEESRKLLSCSWKDPRSEVNPPSPRLFGGFSFGESHQASEAWEAFPPACFLLPEVEIMAGGGSGILTLRRFIPVGEDPSRFRGDLHSRLSAVKKALASFSVGDDQGDSWIPATRAETDPAAWTALVKRALGEVADGTFSKVVLARVQTVSVEGRLDPVEVTLNLWKENPASHVFLFEPSPGATFLGAAPETLATVSEGAFRATTVAGSIARGDTDEDLRSLARALFQSQKDRREHQMCVEDTVERLSAIAGDIRAQGEPHVLTLSTIQHLETVIEARLHPDGTVLSTLEALHPTPAVCGLPRDRAQEFLSREEPFQRGWYAGPVGWFDGDGNGVFVPALRSAVGCGSEWRLFAGAGIVAGSDPSREWDETRIKFQPILRALSGSLALDGSGDCKPVSP
jgi:menaquinone-specific isochorismate synthase